MKQEDRREKHTVQQEETSTSAISPFSPPPAAEWQENGRQRKAWGGPKHLGVFLYPSAASEQEDLLGEHTRGNKVQHLSSRPHSKPIKNANQSLVHSASLHTGVSSLWLSPPSCGCNIANPVSSQRQPLVQLLSIAV